MSASGNSESEIPICLQSCHDFLPGTVTPVSSSIVSAIKRGSSGPYSIPHCTQDIREEMHDYRVGKNGRHLETKICTELQVVL